MAGKRHPDNALSAAKVRTLKEPGRYADGQGLYLTIDPSGNKRWVQRLTIRGQRTDLGLGGYPLVPLKAAREQALDNRQAAHGGDDPRIAKRTANMPTFAEAAAIVIDLNCPTWRNPATAAAWTQSLTDYAFPRIGGKRLDAITSADVLAVLSPLWTSQNDLGRQVKQRIAAVLDWAIASEYRTDNPAAGAITRALPKMSPARRHHLALPYADAPAAAAMIRSAAGLAPIRRAMEFLILTATRTNEARGATWGEVDLAAAVWTIPAERMKSGRPHRVPLSSRALAVLAEAGRPADELIFLGRTGARLGKTTLWIFLRRLGILAVPHGWRSTFRDWAAEQTATPYAVLEAALAHVVGDSTVQAYARSDFFEQRKDLMEAWAQFLGGDD